MLAFRCLHSAREELQGLGAVSFHLVVHLVATVPAAPPLPRIAGVITPDTAGVDGGIDVQQAHSGCTPCALRY